MSSFQEGSFLLWFIWVYFPLSSLHSSLLCLTLFHMFLCTILVTPVVHNVAHFLFHTLACSHTASQVCCLSQVWSVSLMCFLACALAQCLACSFLHTHFFAHILSLSCSFPVSHTCYHRLVLTLSHFLSCLLFFLHSLTRVFALSLSLSFLSTTPLCFSPCLFCSLTPLKLLVSDLFWGKYVLFFYPASGKGLVIQDSSITGDNTALCIFLTGLVSKIFFFL